MPIDDVARLLSRWQRARTPSEQVRVITAAARTLRSLSDQDRRVLAGALVEGGASDAAARIEDAAGARSNADLTAIARSLRTVEPRQLDAIAATLSDPGERRRLAAAAAADLRQGRGDTAASVIAPPPAPPAPDAPAPPAPTGPAVALPPPPTPRPEEPDPSTTPEEPDPSTTRQVPDPSTTPEEPDPSTTDTTTAGHAADRPHERGVQSTAPRSDVTTDVAPTLGALAAAPTARERLRAVADLEDAPIGPDDLVTVLHALPDGWQRRAAARRLLADAPRVDIDAEQVITSFARRSDRTAVAAMLIGHGHAHIETVVDHLDPRAADRLRRRTVSGG